MSEEEGRPVWWSPFWVPKVKNEEKNLWASMSGPNIAFFLLHLHSTPEKRITHEEAKAAVMGRTVGL